MEDIFEERCSLWFVEGLPSDDGISRTVYRMYRIEDRSPCQFIESVIEKSGVQYKTIRDEKIGHCAVLRCNIKALAKIVEAELEGPKGPKGISIESHHKLFKPKEGPCTCDDSSDEKIERSNSSDEKNNESVPSVTFTGYRGRGRGTN